jgi:hypothetical protein
MNSEVTVPEFQKGLAIKDVQAAATNGTVN